MIGLIEGNLVDRELHKDGTAKVLVDVNGVGYELVINARHFQALAPIGTLVSMRVHTHVREGSITLYGFESRDERSLFDLLLGAHGVGPSMALAVLGSMSTSELLAAIHSGDVKLLTTVPGVGSKTAQRLILELAQRLETFIPESSDHREVALGHSEVRSEVSEALNALGYGTLEIREVLRELPDMACVDDLLRAALFQLAPQR
ncbi:MAG TPA: Holliday junction branch migration protein RuvA [Acidimicrobiales bacterium]|nr:Holliday junction branch migration protein RuvA [Acidimicrobiales bacterium]